MKPIELELWNDDINPVVKIVGEGQLAYLWIGTESGEGSGCYGVLSGANLRRLVHDILAALDAAPKKRKVRAAK